ncbi:glycoside hydrolase family 57 [Kosmotoga arenicorallina S304]|uniref:Glycoside hydrolase family 57 n=1 Tax=Kosmotoga arenicorallina S304 TaxID=1453497 RepID=A0A176K2W0_9BACT|nr:glucodextranase DOMON-like domain-containing protein [Kosmotoga arenicorallina]OAA31378.1 glycoside hydrolase family 57 [Kosmotoga arenicorallina S304]
MSKLTRCVNGFMKFLVFAALLIVLLTLFTACSAERTAPVLPQQEVDQEVASPDASPSVEQTAEPKQGVISITFKVTLPSNTPEGPVYIVGSFNEWIPGDINYEMTRSGNMAEITLNLPANSTIEYKYTRGDWGKVEKGEAGEEISNRKIEIKQEPLVIEDIIASWADVAPEVKTEVPAGTPAEITFKVSIPWNTPANDEVYITGTFNNWTTGDPLTILKRDGNIAFITIEAKVGDRIEYKYNRGSWDTVEKDKEGNEISNRVLIVDAEEILREDTVESWIDVPYEEPPSSETEVKEISPKKELPDPENILKRATPADPSKPPLNVVLIWHQHQPLYKIPGTVDYEMPWVRAHAVNDYPYMADLIDKYLTRGSVTINLVPSLLLQLKDYLDKGATDKYLKLSFATELSPEDKQFIIDHFFDINPRFVSKSKRYSELMKKKNSGENFTEQDILDLKVLWNLHWINIEYIEADEELTRLLEKDRGYSFQDLLYVINKQLEIMGEVVEKHKALWESGKVELTTSPFYHPILPILIEKGWESDAQGQIERGLEYFQTLFGKKPEGLWPSEQAVHNELVPMLEKSGISWIVTDKSILQLAGVDTGNYKNIMKPYKVISENSDLIVFFRDTDLSDRIGFRYSTMSAEKAVEDFISRLHELQHLNDSGDAVITIALDGENAWEHYPNNGNDFRKLLYMALSKDENLELLTPSQYISKYGVEDTLDYLPTGSWVGGSLDTWIGEKEENEAWDRVAEAREAFLKAKDSLSPDQVKLALDALYTAEGSDWFWWYGVDQDAGNNEVLFDMAFKKALIQLYRAIGTPEEDIPSYLFVVNKKPAVSTSGAIGVIKPSIDGVMEEGEWDKAAYYKDLEVSTMAAEDDLIAGFYIGRDNANLYLAVELKRDPRSLLGEPLYLEIYTDLPGAQKINTVPRYPFKDEKDSFGFVLAKRFLVSFKSWKIRPGRLSNYNAAGDGKWSIDPELPSLEDSAAIGETVEIKIPLDALGIKTGQEFNLAISISNSKEKALIDYAPKSGPVHVQIPQAVTGRVVAVFQDPTGDDYGFGSYQYPLNTAFEPYKGLWDIEWLKVLENEQAVIFQLKFNEMTNPWNAPKGFSHQLINLYIDVKDGGRTDTYAEGARVSFSDEFPWDYFIKVAGWPSYGQVFATADGEEIPDTVQVEADPGEKIINVIVNKAELGTFSTMALYVLSGSQDGYGPDNFRAVTPEPSEWTLGGYPLDAGDFAPFVLDIIVPEETTQEEVLSSYDKNSEKYATLVPVIIDF